MTQGGPQYFEEMTLLRAVAVISVVAIHTTATFPDMLSRGLLYNSIYVLNSLVGFAVPLFIFISGFVLYNKYPTVTNLKSFYYKRMLTVVIPYIIFHLIGRVFGSFYHLWFLTLIAELYIIYPFIIEIYSYSKKINMTIGLVLSSFIISLIVNHWPIPITIPIAFLFLPYLLLGVLIRDNYDKVKEVLLKLPVYTPIAIIPVLGLRMIDTSTIMTPIYCSVAPLICLSLVIGKESRVLSLIGKKSFGIYLVHVPILAIIVTMLSLNGITIDTWFYYPISIVIIVTLSIILVQLVQKIPYGQYIIGNNR